MGMYMDFQYYQVLISWQIRYYTIFLLAFDVAQIHSFTRPGVATVDVYEILNFLTEFSSHYWP